MTLLAVVEVPLEEAGVMRQRHGDHLALGKGAHLLQQQDDDEGDDGHEKCESGTTEETVRLSHYSP